MADSEKITINMSVVDLGKVDLLVEEGFYSNRTDFIRTSIRNQLDRHSDEVKQSVTRKTMAVGVVGYGRKSLEARQAAGEIVSAWVVGSLTIDDDVWRNTWNNDEATDLDRKREVIQNITSET